MEMDMAQAFCSSSSSFSVSHRCERRIVVPLSTLILSPAPLPSISTKAAFLNNGALASRFSGIAGSRMGAHRKRNAFVRCRSVRIKAFFERTDILKVLGTVVKLGKEGLDIGTKLVPEVVPRPLAQAGVAIIGFVVLTTLLNSLFSTALFILAIGALSYFVYFYFNKEERPSGDSTRGDEQSTEKTLEEARKIMEKYK
ncbi:hypothetical protein O6H91_10G067100 [Diphasiastrum complanatum]|uniref:Uncharacterized protein n=1 Tax=Diphasiastrum complanatum TaxID=34168 RepID=A0ACC2CHX1_DIPCM|nr:hypothetical protein O6H91_10G067100 [Diphasiastrum complanatum]